ncbi:2775_t:CDS:2, partial [Scutellospora calospora]
MTRRKKRQKEKKKQKAREDSNMDIDDDLTEINASDMLTPIICHNSHYPLLMNLLVLMSLTNNTLELYTIGLPVKKKDKLLENTISSKLYSVDLPGHRNDVRTLALSFDDELFSFLPGNRNVIIGTKLGYLELFDIASSSQIESIKAYDGPIWSLQVRPDKRELVTGSADSNVKFWEFSTSQKADTNESQ